MTDPVYRTDRPVTLLGAGDASPDDLEQACRRAPQLFAADGGADTARKHNKVISAVIGDLDSLNIVEYWQKSGIPIHHDQDPQTTDFEKCLQTIEAPGYVGVGFLGLRVDHQMAALHALARFADRKILLIGPHDVICHCSGRVSFKAEIGQRVSLFPLLKVTGVHSTGLEWNITGLTMESGIKIGTSNRASSTRVAFEFDDKGCLLMLPRASFGALADHLFG